MAAFAHIASLTCNSLKPSNQYFLVMLCFLTKLCGAELVVTSKCHFAHGFGVTGLL